MQPDPKKEKMKTCMKINVRFIIIISKQNNEYVEIKHYIEYQPD